jgi:hypothetical protein
MRRSLDASKDERRMDDNVHPCVPSSVIARWREELIGCGYGGKEMKWWPLCRL